MKNFILLIIFSFSLSLYSGDELFPFGMNYTVVELFGDSLPESDEYKQKYKIAMDLCAQAGIKWWRAMYAFRWCDVETLEDDWDFDTEDSLVKWCGERGLHLLPSIGYTADYAIHPDIATFLDPENRRRYPPNPDCWDKYEDYVEKLVERYDGDDTNDMPGLGSLLPIKYWECMNEPYGIYFLGTPEQYVEMFKSTRVALKSADPDGKIVGPCMATRADSFKWKYFDTGDGSIRDSSFGYTSWQNATISIIDAIDLDSIDVVSHHIYSNTANFMKYTRELRDTLEQFPSGENKPIWITETGFQNSDPFRAERGRKQFVDSASDCVTYSCDIEEVFWDTVWAKWTYQKPCSLRIDTFLKIGDTVILEYRTDWWRKDTIIYNGDSLVYEGKNDTVTALAIGDTLTIFHLWAEEYNNTSETQLNNYSKLLDSVLNTADFMNNLKIFFFGANSDINETYYPPKITFGNLPPWKGGGYEVTAYYKQRSHSHWSVLDTMNDPYPAYYSIRDSILLPSDQTIPSTTVGTGESKTYQAMNSITTNTLTIKGNSSTGGKVAMEAGDKIHLKSSPYDYGFRVEEGGYFHAVTNPLYGEGGGGMSSMKTSKPLAIKPPAEDAETDSIPKVFSCSQNYPNPFAQSTTIKYGLPKDSEVQLDIYNLIGQKVHTLVNTKQSAGYKQVSWDGKTCAGTQAPQGIYFYTFEAGDFEKHHKMILLK
jgi:hypothetical protein